MGTEALAVVLLSLLSVATTAAGVALAHAVRQSARAVAGGIGFSTGLMVLIAGLELIPEAASAQGTALALASAAAGAALVWMAHLVVPHWHLTDESGIRDTAVTRSAQLVVLGLVLHDLPEGFALANAYIASPGLGVLTAVGIALHNLPEEFAMALPAVALRSKRFILGAALASALAEPVGAVIGLVAVGIAPAFNAPFLSLAAGAMVFVAVHELIPMGRRYGHLAHFGLGIILSGMIYVLLARLSPSVVASMVH
jgi:ZIP family zinc transporter